jgi:hypothetical protein
MLPNFLIIGAQKAGTTWLYDVLRMHPDIFLPDTKELSYFCQLDSDGNQLNYFNQLDISWYKDFFAARTNETAIGEISPMYLCDEVAPERIALILPSVKLIAVLRDPVERAVSEYWMTFNKRDTMPPLARMQDQGTDIILRRGLYGVQLQKYFSLFPNKNILVLVFEEMMADRDTTLDLICRFLEVDPCLQPRDRIDTPSNAATAYRSRWLHTFSVKAATTLRAKKTLSWLPRLLKKTGFNAKVKSLNAVEFRKPPLTEEERAALRQYYAGDRERLERLLGRKIEAWPR